VIRGRHFTVFFLCESRRSGGTRIPFQVAKMVIIKLREVCSCNCSFQSNFLKYLLGIELDEELPDPSYKKKIEGRLSSGNASLHSGRAIPEAGSRWLPTAAGRVCARVWSSGICGGHSGAGAGFLRVV
jgi:hypothetical protein